MTDATTGIVGTSGFTMMLGEIRPRVEYSSTIATPVPLSKNYAPQIAKIANEFVHHVDAEKIGLKRRFALKFGLVYAAMVLGVKFGLLPWPDKYSEHE